MYSTSRWTCFVLIFIIHTCSVSGQGCGLGRFGINCEGICHCASIQRCSSFTGICWSGGCQPGWTENNCQTPICPGGQFGNPCISCNCLDSQEVCDKRTGACSSGCAAGYTGTDCKQAIVTCPDRQFGNACIPCNCLNSQEVCHGQSGICSSGCAEGFTGSNCQQACLIGRFGSNCGGICHCSVRSACSSVDGVCSSGVCQTGWSGADCQTPTSATPPTTKPATTKPATTKATTTKSPTVCPNGQFGNPCKPCNCLGICHKATGFCGSGCVDGFRGLDCQQVSTCLDGRFGSPCRLCNCLDTQEICNKETGSCTSGCPAGFTGVDCQEVAPPTTKPATTKPATTKSPTACPNGQFGNPCKPCNCLGICHKITGFCGSGCVDGFRGLDCQQVSACPDGRFGSPCRLCNCRDTQEICNKETGSCTSGCPAGSTGVGCQEGCQLGTFGTNCEGICRCSLVFACRQEDGSCMFGACLDGWSGTNCQTNGTRLANDPQTHLRLVTLTKAVPVLTVVSAGLFLIWRGFSR